MCHRFAQIITPGVVAFEGLSAQTGCLSTLQPVVTDQAIAVQLDRGADCDDRMAVGLALHRAAQVVEADTAAAPS